MIRMRDVLIGTKGRIVWPADSVPQDSLFRAIAIDSRQATSDALFFALPGTVTDGHAFIDQAAANGATAAVVREDWVAARDLSVNPPPLALVAVPETLTALHDLAAWWRTTFDAVPVIGITGSVGKTSTKELIATVLGAKYKVLKTPGNLNAITSMPVALLGMTPDTQVAVLEMALYDPGDITTMARIARPTIGVITNIGVSHLERLGSQEAIANEKGALIAALPESGTAVLNGDDPIVRAQAARTRAHIVTYGLDAGNEIRASEVESSGLSGIGFRLTMPGMAPVTVRLPLLGRHSVHTALAATAVARTMGMALEEILAGLEGEQTQLRLYTVPGPNGAVLIDDTYNSSPQSSLAALNLLADLDARRRIAVFADMLELGAHEVEGHTRVGGRAAAVLDRLYTFGTRARVIADTALHAGMHPEAIAVFDADQRADLAARLMTELSDGDIVLIKGSRGMHMEELVTAIRTPRAADAVDGGTR
jgi:UDP-N-acetylmuramoyl-tripeptide--D-alanyl-D-alanine ligase